MKKGFHSVKNRGTVPNIIDRVKPFFKKTCNFRLVFKKKENKFCVTRIFLVEFHLGDLEVLRVAGSKRLI